MSLHEKKSKSKSKSSRRARARKCARVEVILERRFEGTIIYQSARDGYIDATSMAISQGSRLYKYTRTKRAKRYIAACKQVTGRRRVTRVGRAGNDKHKATWFHPLLAGNLAMYLNTRLGLKVLSWCSLFVSEEDRTPAAQNHGRASNVQEEGKNVHTAQGEMSSHDEPGAAPARVHEQGAAAGVASPTARSPARAEAAAPAPARAEEAAALAPVVHEGQCQPEQSGGGGLQALLRRMERLEKVELSDPNAEEKQYDGLFKIAQAGRSRAEGQPAKAARREGEPEEDACSRADLATNGRDNEAAYSFIQETFANMCEKLMKYKRLHGGSGRDADGTMQKVLFWILHTAAPTRVLQLDSAAKLSATLGEHIKRLDAVQDPNHISLGELYPYTARYNNWVLSSALPHEFLLLEQLDMQMTFDYTEEYMPASLICRAMRALHKHIAETSSGDGC